MKDYFLAEWTKTRKIQLLVIGIAFLSFSSMIGLGIYIAGLLLVPEFERKTLDMLKANQVSMRKLYLGKLMSSFLLILPIQLLLLLIFIVSAKIDGISFNLSLATHVKWIALSLLSSFPIITLQSYITVKTRNFSKGVGVAIIGSMLNFVLIFINESFTKFFPYSQPMIGLRSRAL
ncbi:TPA: ABC transporter permease, partial [Streptococcus suis]|nr:ABC transporter permease [Streptococcus suis]